MKHVGCIGADCPICPKLEQPGYERVRSNLRPPAIPAPPTPCAHLGQPTGETVRCPSCRGVQVKLFACSIYGRCTVAKPTTNTACCAGKRGPAGFDPCPSYTPRVSAPTEPMLGSAPGSPQPRGVLTLGGRRWAYGVTTVPSRRDNLLPKTLRSLKAGGFPDPRLFVDCEDDKQADWYRSQGFENPVTAHWPPLRVHANWVLSLYELFLRDSAAERFAVFQDDLLCVRNLRAYLDACPYPDGPVNRERVPGYWNLYTAPSNEEFVKGGGGWHLSNQFGRGAVALVFSREAAITLLSQRHMVDRICDTDRGWRSVDGGIVTAMAKAGWKEYVHSPSLVMHTGVASTVDKRKRSNGSPGPTYQWPANFAALGFPGEDFDAQHLLTCTPVAEGSYVRS